MPLVPLQEILIDARQRCYAIGGFDTWSVDSIQAIAAAAEETQSPALILAEPEEIHYVGAEYYISAALLAARKASVPIAIQWNETDSFDEAVRAMALGFNAVMIENRGLPPQAYAVVLKDVVKVARPLGVSVQGEVGDMPEGHGAEIVEAGDLSTPDAARHFVDETGVDVLAVPFGNVHGLRDRQARLDLEHLTRMGRAAAVPLVAHGSTGIAPEDFPEIIRAGVGIFQVGTTLRLAYLGGEAELPQAERGYVAPMVRKMAGARVALQRRASELMVAYRSAGKA